MEETVNFLRREELDFSIKEKLVALCVKFINDFDNYLSIFTESTIKCIMKNTGDPFIHVQIAGDKIYGRINLGYKIADLTHRRDYNFVIEEESEVKDFLEKIKSAIKREEELSLMIIDSHLK